MKNTVVSLLVKSSKIVSVFFFMLTMLFSTSTFAQTPTGKATITLQEIQMLIVCGLIVFVGVLLVIAALTIYSNSRTMFGNK
ncbi:hypothetical protein WAF17_08085 [Bernardetia sp. ABR2-2B]|uniref:hypothetical protein n=1 Tax=Bernardetia sp. ABR2-2B TaxID=3127472 RepID=UPI0030D27B05